MTPHHHTESLRHEAEMIEAGIAVQDQGLRMLLAEMRALAQLMPGRAEHHQTEAEIEEQFDNMPV